MSVSAHVLMSLAQTGGSDEPSMIIAILFLVVMLAFMVFIIAAIWKTFEKAGQPGWGAIIPIYNIVLMMNVAGRPTWWVVLYLLGAIPIIGPIIVLVVGFIVSLDIARNFGKGTGFGIGLALVPFVFFPILGFGSAEYSPVKSLSAGDPVDRGAIEAGGS